jgi:hypothetical protein
MRVFKAPEPIVDTGQRSIFLAGTIDNGDSADWQSELCYFFEDKKVNIYNPRRTDWNDSWKQYIDNTDFNRQVQWELDAMDKADWIIMNFLADSKSPITLLELGLQAASQKLVVCCPDDFYRSGNVHIVCKKYHIPCYKSMNTLLEQTKFI